MKKINVLQKYNILIERGLLAKAGVLTREISKAKTAVIVTDSNVAPIYADVVARSLAAADFNVSIFTFPAGEANKNIATVTDMLDFFAKQQLTRSDIVIALGGGVCGDLAGFAAAIYLRGIAFVQIPTTLLAQIDSSVGGKTGCDLPSGKNLCGAFHHPSLVIIDPDVLSTLPDEYMRDGMGEAIKYGCIRSKDLFMRLENEAPFSFIDELIYECVAIKAGIVENDFTERNERMLLNFGHTFGHAIEKYENFCGISHGSAVGIGMVMLTRAAEKAGLCEIGAANKIIFLLQKYGLPFEHSAPVSALFDAVLSDKKRRGDNINIVLIKTIGDGFVYTLPCDELKQLVE